MLYGEYNYSIDEKGRLNFPAKFKEDIGKTFTITRWLDNCVIAFPKKEWDRIAEVLSEKSMVKSRDVQRFLYSTAVEVTPDKQGRILVPENLRTHASLKKEITIIGVGKYAEIWDTETWNERNVSLPSELIEEAMVEIGF